MKILRISDFQKGLLIVLIAFFCLGGLLFTTRLLMADAFSKEEAQHALYSLWLYKDIRAFDWGGFWYDTNRQVVWPFFHSWLGALFFLIFGVGYLPARLLSFLLFFATLLLMYAACCRFSEKLGWKIGALAALLALTSPLMLRFAVMNTLESLGAFLFMATFYVYSIYEERLLTYEYALLAALLGLAIFTNYLYAFLMLPAFIVMTLGKLGPIVCEVIVLRRKGESHAFPFVWWAYRKLIVLLVLALFVAGWFFTSAFSRKLLLLLQSIFRYSGGEPVANIWQSLAYYPQAIINHFTFSPWLGALILLSLFLPFLGLHFHHIGKLYTFIWTVLVLATLVLPAKAPQVIYIIAPFTFIVFAATVFYALEEHYQRLSAAFLLAVFLPALISLPTLAGQFLPARPGEKMSSVLDYFRREVRPRFPVAAQFNLQHLNPEGVSFHFWAWNAPVLSDPALGEEGMFRGARYFLAVKLDENSPYRAELLDDSASTWNSFLAEKLRQGWLREYSARRFEPLGLTAMIYEKQETAAR
ncbi:MAG: glycosyltransferase family 39 protein [Candidatus Saganbacteria bacterium]|nr:glycosyltransferase family 39 protein [Candidatus Saganbacteria bacterium]